MSDDDMPLKERLGDLLSGLMMIPGISGREDRVRRHITGLLEDSGLTTSTDRLGNLICTVAGAEDAPSLMVFAHMDQLGLMVRKVEADGFIRVERLGGIPEKALPSQSVVLCVGEGRDVPAIIANKSHHATAPDEKYRVLTAQELYIDAGFASVEEANAAGVDIGTPVIYEPKLQHLAGDRLAGAAVDDRAGCAALIELARDLNATPAHPTVHVVFSVQEEFNLMGASAAARVLEPDMAIQVDLTPATDTPDLDARGSVHLGKGPVMSLYSFHGRGTLNGTLPHPAMVALIANAARSADIPLQRVANTGILTDNSYVQHAGAGVACIDVGFPTRYTHSSLEVCDLNDLEALTRLLIAAVRAIGPEFSLDRDDYT